jgi:hypothetical protein
MVNKTQSVALPQVEHAILLMRGRRAEQVIAIMRTFVRLRETLSLRKELAHKQGELERKIENHDENIRTLFEAIHSLMTPPETLHREIVFHVKKDSAPYRLKVRRK